MKASESFPEGFVFGVSSSALQTEEASNHDWAGLKARDGSVMWNNVEHLKHWKDDYALIKELGVDAYRTSVDWARLQKEPYGELESCAVEQYEQMFDFLKSNDIDLLLTLHHFANPDWFVRKGGWERKESSDVFADFAEKATLAFSAYTKDIITINEPSTYISLAYLAGFLPPHGKSILSGAKGYKKVGDHMAEAHRKTYLKLKNKYGDSKGVTFSETKTDFVPYGKKLMDKVGACVADYLTNTYLWDKMAKHPEGLLMDFIALNSYGGFAFDFKNPEHTRIREGVDHDDIFEVNPDSMIDFARELSQRYDRGLAITENGTCTEDDGLRQRNLVKTLHAIQRANQEDTLIQGYFHWSLLDNFELYRGMSKHMGLVAVDEKTMERKPKESYHIYKRIINERRL